MRVLLAADPILPVPPHGYGGIERIVDALSRELRARGHVVGLVAKAGSTCDVDAIFAWPGANVRGRVDMLRNVLALRRAASAFQPDVIHSFARLSYLTALLPTHVFKIMSYQRHTGPRPIARALHLARRGTLRFTGCSEFICTLGQPGGGTWTVVPNFADLQRIEFVPQVDADAPLLFLSRIEAIKGPDLAIAIARRSGRRLVLAGNRATVGSEARFFEEKIAPHLGRDGIEYVGEVDDEQKNRLLGRAAGLLVPVQWDEPFGIVFAEALAAGTPVVSCARGALPEIVEPGRTGFLIRDIDEGVAAIRRLPDVDRARCRTVAEQRFSATACTARYEQLYRECLG